MRSCSGTLAWDGGDLPVSTEMSQLDVDVLGADLGLGTPVVAFQVKKSAADWDMTYLIYSLQKPPQLLRTITGGDFFRAADTDLSLIHIFLRREFYSNPMVLAGLTGPGIDS